MTAIALLGAGVVGVLVLVFLGYVLLGDDTKTAAERTSQRSVGLVSGALGTFVAALTVGVEAVLSAPELLITLLGVGAIVSGISWQVFGATAFTVWIVGRTVERGRAS